MNHLNCNYLKVIGHCVKVSDCELCDYPKEDNLMRVCTDCGSANSVHHIDCKAGKPKQDKQMTTCNDCVGCDEPMMSSTFACKLYVPKEDKQTMYIDELIKKWREGWRGTAKDDEGEIYRLEGNGIHTNDNDMVVLEDYNMERTYTIVPEPVSFEEAREAYQNRKNTKPVSRHEYMNTSQTPKPLLQRLCDEYGYVEATNLVLGKWEIEP